MNKLLAAASISVLALAGCASAGSGLVAGKSTSRDVEAAMGAPSERVATAGGDALWYFSRQPMGRQMYVVRLDGAGVLRSIDQVLTEENLKNLSPGVTTAAQARALLGPPWRTSHNPRTQRDVWTYTMFNATQWDYFLHVQLSGDGIVREVLLLKDYVKETGDKD